VSFLIFSSRIPGCCGAQTASGRFRNIQVVFKKRLMVKRVPGPGRRWDFS
jgi:hypothetical protein